MNKKVVDYNMEEKSLTSQRLVYDAIHNGNAKLTDFQVTSALRKVACFHISCTKLNWKRRWKRGNAVVLI